MPYQPHRVYAKWNDEFICNRTVGDKTYEIKDHLGNVRVLVSDLKTTADTVDVKGYNDYYPFGMIQPGRNFNASSYRFGFNGKEMDDEWTGNTGVTYDYGFRIYDARIGKFLSVDPLTKDYPFYTPYQFAGNSPIMAIDLDGLEPKSVVHYNETTKKGHFTEPAIHLLHLTTGVKKDILRQAVIQPRKAGQYRPFYSANKGGGAITLGTKNYQTITYTENFFENDPSAYEGHGYGLDAYEWLDLSAHEVGHIPQLLEEGGLSQFVIEITGQYIKHGHDEAPLEIEAESGAERFRAFSQFTNKYFGKESIGKLLRKDISDEQKINKLNLWYDAYETYQSKIKEGADPDDISINDFISTEEKE